MSGRRHAIALWITWTVCSGAALSAQEVELDSLITARMERDHLPGVAAAAIDSGRVVWIGTYGLANVERSEPVTERTPFHIASVSKPITATILLSLHADGRFALDDDVSAYLPFELRNPRYPDVPITFRQLLRHRSSVRDNPEYYGDLWGPGNGDPTTELGDYLRDYLSVDGGAYSAEGNFHGYPPDGEYRYCNTCYALLGYLAERIGGMPYRRISRDRLFAPLGMSQTAWFLSDLDDRSVAMPYRFAQDTGYVAYGHGGYPDWPAGQLRTSIRDLARFLSVYAWGGRDEGVALIEREVVELMSPVRADVGFHTWSQMSMRDRSILYSHGGGDPGVRTLIAFRRFDGRGVIVLANGDGPVEPIAEEVFLAITALKEASGGSPRGGS